MREKHWRPRWIYRIILKWALIPSVDFIIIRTRGGRKEFLLCKRIRKPYKGKWFIVGGQLARGESLEAAVRHHLKRELGIVPKSARFFEHYMCYNPPNELGERYYSLWHVYIVRLRKEAALRLNGENGDARWFSSVDPRWPYPVRRVLLRAGFPPSRR